MTTAGAGLEGIVATTSKICYIDGNQGVLSYFGYNIHTLAENATFEEVIYLLWNGALPNAEQLRELKSSLAAERDLAPEVTAFLKNAPQGAPPMDVLRTAVSMLSLYDPLTRECEEGREADGARRNDRDQLRPAAQRERSDERQPGIRLRREFSVYADGQQAG